MGPHELFSPENNCQGSGERGPGWGRGYRLHLKTKKKDACNCVDDLLSFFPHLRLFFLSSLTIPTPRGVSEKEEKG